MRLASNQSGQKSHDGLLLLDWESLGRCVRKRTLETLAMHFAAVAAADTVLTENAVSTGNETESERLSEYLE